LQQRLQKSETGRLSATRGDDARRMQKVQISFLWTQLPELFCALGGETRIGNNTDTAMMPAMRWRPWE